jgi:hypothetical protein
VHRSRFPTPHRPSPGPKLSHFKEITVGGKGLAVQKENCL